jgi:ribosome-binding protein aMBF1 (putative translation factor)
METTIDPDANATQTPEADTIPSPPASSPKVRKAKKAKKAKAKAVKPVKVKTKVTKAKKAKPAKTKKATKKAKGPGRGIRADGKPRRKQGTNPPKNKATRAYGKKVAAARLKKGWTQKELARRAGLSQPGLANIERGVAGASEKAQAKIAKALKGPGKKAKAKR